MPFSVPSLADLVTSIAGDIKSRLTNADALLRRSTFYVAGRVIAGAARGLYGFIQYLADQLFVATAEKTYLERHASLKGLARKLPAVATGTAVATASTPTTIPAGQLLQRSDNQQFVTTAAVTIAGGPASLPLAATLGGTAGNTAAATTLTFLNPIAGVTVTVDGNGLTGGTDTETDDELRARLLDVWQNPPQGGAAADYEEWAKEVPGVTRAFVFKYWQGPGTVGVAFVLDDQAGSIIPGAGTVTAVQAQLDVKAPVTATPYAITLQAVTINVAVHLQIDNSVNRAAVLASLADLFRTAGEPGTVLFHDLIEATVQDAGGGGQGDVVSPAGDTVIADYQVAELGAVTFQ
ncbi:MAG TPA: baseplate J/gp47 family protein [Aliidongia sp.]|uniref:baseplate J/gp47 family protein n=1 Tax=Aliidongia sp. TaxID=1914230 RepID=UPI002DDD607A|nr:baseplate J/gp47 family protein [Aliidongia sp.]HEV2674235.1 baseplate J/gp47 family protein [Aliidongia sp.]